MVGLTDRPDMALDVYRGRKITTQQQQQQGNYNIKRLQAVSLILYLEIFVHGQRTEPSCSKLTTSLVNVSLKFQMLISEICQYFC